eukprot:TRINITY_DN13140_c0_g1_i1.p1 TRINITY_DN13140_c0_g1~~TRINITY_DN13140_c0_g1_i1.p1  ORF type:complete len:228 (+),score=16.53 TRINITY_DN13140_c0_g1_i1:780-1463(+)
MLKLRKTSSQFFLLFQFGQDSSLNWILRYIRSCLDMRQTELEYKFIDLPFQNKSMKTILRTVEMFTNLKKFTLIIKFDEKRNPLYNLTRIDLSRIPMSVEELHLEFKKTIGEIEVDLGNLKLRKFTFDIDASDTTYEIDLFNSQDCLEEAFLTFHGANDVHPLIVLNSLTDLAVLRSLRVHFIGPDLCDGSFALYECVESLEYLQVIVKHGWHSRCLLYTSPSPRDS